MSLMKIRVLEFQENIQNNDSNLGKTFYLHPQFLLENKLFEQVFYLFNTILFLKHIILEY